MNKKILIIDDEPDMHELLKVHLNKIDGAEILSAYSAEEGVKKYKELYEKGEAPALVIMDLNLSGKEESIYDEMPEEMDGVVATREILEIDPSAIIWGYTAWFGTKWAEKLKEAGVKRVVGRPLPFKDFAEMVEDFLQK